MSRLDDVRAEFVKASVGHGSLDRAEQILAAHPELAGADIHTAAILGDDASVRRFLAMDRSHATATADPLGWDALTHLCFSRYLRLDASRSDAFLRAAGALLDAGASANTGYWDDQHRPHPQHESVLYGAAGVAHHAGLTRLLLDRGADPNDGELPYHAPETRDLAALAVLLESGKLSPDSLATMLLRKADWHDLEGVRLLLAHGADPNRMTPWGYTALHQALRRDNDLAIVETLLEHGADPLLPGRADGRAPVVMAARRGRGDVLESLERRGVDLTLAGVERLIAACARDDSAAVTGIAAAGPALVRELVAEGGTLLAEFSGVGNDTGVAHLLGLGIDVDVPYGQGDGYFGIAPNSRALHVAAWRARPSVVKLLLERGATVDALDGAGQTPLVLAVRACVDSYWADRRTPESIEALLRAGASASTIALPTGYPEADDLLRSYAA